MRIIEHFFNKSSGESTIFLDLQPNLCIVYVTKHGLQLLDPKEKPLETEEAHEVMRFIEEYLFTISQNETKITNETEQPIVSSESKASDAPSEVIESPSKEDSKPNEAPSEERGEAKDLGCGVSETSGQANN